MTQEITDFKNELLKLKTEINQYINIYDAMNDKGQNRDFINTLKNIKGKP